MYVRDNGTVVKAEFKIRAGSNIGGRAKIFLSSLSGSKHFEPDM